MTSMRRIIVSCLWLLCGGAFAQQATFDANTSTLTIPAIKVGAASYSNITLRPTASGTFAITGGSAGSTASTITNELSLTTGIMTLPSLKIDVAGAAVYYKNVTFLLKAGTLEFSLTGGEPDNVNVPASGGTSTLTIQVTLLSSLPGAPTIPSITVTDVPKPTSESEFCGAAQAASGSQSLGALIGQYGSFTIDRCAFDGSVGSIGATLKLALGFLTVDLKYSATYSYK